jgi:hypothetical protein
MNGRWADANILLHIGFGRRPAVQARIQVDIREILTLLGCEAFCCETHAGHPIQLFIRASGEQEPNRALRTHGAS